MNQHSNEPEDKTEEDITKEVIKEEEEGEEERETRGGDFLSETAKEVEALFSGFAEIKLRESEFELGKEGNHLMGFSKVSRENLKKSREESDRNSGKEAEEDSL